MTPNYARTALELFARYGDEEAIVHGDRRLRYTELVTGVHAMMEILRQQGIRSGNAVAVLAGNPPESVMVQFALHLLGCRSVWIAPNAPAVLSVEYLKLAEVDAFVYDARTHRELGEHLAAGAPQLAAFCFGPGGASPDLALLWSGASGDQEEHDVEPHSVFQTGGTTGRPKLVLHRHDFYQLLLAAAERFAAAGHPQLRHIGVTGFWHSSAQAAAMMTLFTGGLLVMLDRFDAKRYLAMLQRERITSAILPPPMLYQLLDHPDLSTTDTSSLANFYCAGSAVAPSRLAEAMERFGTVMMTSYGMSEATSIASYPTSLHDPAHPERLASCGKPTPPSRVEIRDDLGRALPAGEVGEVWASGGLMTSGYWGEPELTAATLVDGWLRTGDVGYLDADGYLYLVDRVKDIIVTGLTSSNVYSRTVEDVLNAHPQVRSAAVIGVPHEQMGQAVHAVVELTDDATVGPDELREWALAGLNELWAPSTVEIVERLPLTEAGKIDKKALRAGRAVVGGR